MQKLIRLSVLSLGAVLSTGAFTGCAGKNVTDPYTATDRESMAEATIDQFKNKDPGLSRFFENSAGHAVFPKVGKGGLIVGGGYGEGVVYEKGMVGGYATVTMASIGAQIGGQTFKEIIFFETPADLDRFKREKTEFGAQVSAVALENGASSNASYHDGVAVFVFGEKGLMAEASVGGQKFRYFPKN